MVLVPVLRLTETETNYENAPARQAPTMTRAGPGKPIIAPTVTPTTGWMSVPTESPPRLNFPRPTTADTQPPPGPRPTSRSQSADRDRASSINRRPDSTAVGGESPLAGLGDENADAGKSPADEETSEASPPRIMTGGQGEADPTPSQPRLLSIGSRLISANLDGNFVIADQTLAPGGAPITAWGKSIYLEPSAAAAVIDGTTVSVKQALPQPSDPTPAVLPIGSNLITANPQGNFVIAGQTLVPGGSPIVASGKSISLQTSGSAAVIDGTTVALAPAPQVVHFGTHALVKEKSGGYIIGSQTLMPGTAPITVDGVPFALAPSASALVVGSSTLVPHAALRVLRFGDRLLTEDDGGRYVVGSQTLIPGDAPITVEGTPFSLAPSASALVVGTRTMTPAAAIPPVLRFGKQLLPADDAGGYILGSQTLVPGNPPITIAGTRVSLAPSGSALIIGSETLPRNPIPTLPTILIHQVTEPAKTASEHLIAGQTLVPGAPPISIFGQPISLAGGESHVVIGSSTQSLPSENSGLASLILNGFDDVSPEATPTEEVSGSAAVVSAFTGGAGRCGEGKVKVLWMALSLCMGFGLFSIM